MWLWEAGLYHYKARAYSPSLRRFLQTDPKGYDAGMNVYAYVGGDPINATDPSGMLLTAVEAKACIGGDSCNGGAPGDGDAGSGGPNDSGSRGNDGTDEITVTGSRGGSQSNGAVQLASATIPGASQGLQEIVVTACGSGACHSKAGPTLSPVPPTIFENRGPPGAPKGTRPIDSWGIPTGDIHDIKKGLKGDGIGAPDDTFVSPDGSIYDSSGGYLGHVDDFTKKPLPQFGAAGDRR